MTIALSAVVVLALSTLRFPQGQPLPEAPPAPLERLVATAAYEQLARSVERVSGLITPALLPLRFDAGNGHPPRTLARLFRNPVGQDATRHSPALRVSNEHAVVVGADARPGAAFVDLQGRPLAVVAADPLRQLAVLAVPQEPTTPVLPVMASDLQAPTYVVVAEGTAAGVTFRPVFIGSADRFSDARWTRPLLAVSGSPLTTPGSLVFSLGGQFIGPAVLGADGTLAVAAAAEVMAAVGEASAGHILASRDFGLHLQSLTPTLGRLLHATQGVVVADVDSNSPAAGALEPADVITSIDGVAIASPDEALVLLARTRPEATVQVAIVRQGAPQTVSVTGDPSKARGAGGQALPRMERVAGEGTRISEVPPGTALADAGVQAGDIVIRLGSTAAPAPQEVTSALRAGADGIGVVLVIRRDGEDRVIGIPPSSAPR